jgi:hypothetical protein
MFTHDAQTGGYEYINAPQMQEIALLLPPTWTLDSWANQLHFEDSMGNEPCFLEYLKNNHYAEHFAHLYLRLKETGLLEKEAQNV